MMLRTNRVLMICATSALLAAGAEPLLAQPPAGRQGQSRQEVLRQRIMQRVLGGVPMTAQDSMVQRIVERLDFENYKALIKGLTQFGDREQGTERNERAVDWIEQQLRSWGYETERVHYEYRGEPRSQVYATKVGSTAPGEMYILGAHMDGRGGGEAANDDASGTALVMEIARVLASPDIETTRSIRFALWNNEETGLNGSRAYVEQRAALQGIEDPPGSGRYPEPKWLGMIQHDMMLWDHGNPVQHSQVLDADVDIEFQLNSAKAEESARAAQCEPQVCHGLSRRDEQRDEQHGLDAVHGPHGGGQPAREPPALRDRHGRQPALAPADGPVRDVLGRGLPPRLQRRADHARRGREAGGRADHGREQLGRTVGKGSGALSPLWYSAVAGRRATGRPTHRIELRAPSRHWRPAASG